MDIQEIAALLHIHEKASAHGASMVGIRDWAAYGLMKHNAEAKEEVAKIRAEEQKEADAKAEAAAEAIRKDREASEQANEGMTERAEEQRLKQVEDDKAKAVAHAETMRKAAAKTNPGSDGPPKAEPVADLSPPIITEPQPTIADRRL